MKLVNGLLGIRMKKNFISVVENLRVNFRIVNYTFYMPFNLKDQKKKCLKKVMKFQNLSRKKLSRQLNKTLTLKSYN